MECGAVMAGAGAEERERVRRAGEWAGRAFQIIDDVLDVESDGATLGKTPGKDERDGKLTYPSVVGVAASRVEAATLIARADEVFRGKASAELLRGLLAFMVERRR
jgi:geranylgeranyl diphosphate synthase type II